MPTTTTRRRTGSRISTRCASETRSARPTSSAPGSRSRTARSSTPATSGRGLIGVTRLKLGRKEMSFPAVNYPLLQNEPERGDGWVRFTQTAGGRMGLPAPQARARQALLPGRERLRLDDLAARHLHRRHRQGGARRRQPLPAPLDLRPRRKPRREVGLDRLRRLVPGVVRPEHALGRERLDRRSSRPSSRSSSASCLPR